MKKHITGLLLFLFIAGFMLILTACGNASNNGTVTTSSNSTSVASTAPSQRGNIAEIKDFAFTPGTIEINKGETVVWKNKDSAVHTVTSDVFDSGSMQQGDSFQYTFNTSGTFNYHCGNHPSMMGVVKVK